MENECISIHYICENDKCQGTGSLVPYPEGNIDTMEWVVAYQCSKCYHVKYTCLICTTGTHRLIKSRLRRHAKSETHILMQNNIDNGRLTHFNSAKKRKLTDNDQLLCNKIEVYEGSLGSISSMSSNGQHTKQEYYDTQESYEYFSRNTKTSGDYDGPSYLVGLAVCKTKDAYNHIGADDILLHLMLAKFTSGLTRYQRHEFSFILKLLKKWYINQYTKSETRKKSSETNDASSLPMSSDIISTHIPTNEYELRNLYLVGGHAVVNNLPKPEVALVDGHSYVSLRYAISDFLGKGKLPAKMQYEKN